VTIMRMGCVAACMRIPFKEALQCIDALKLDK
jgi:hypothetical protein